MYYNERFKILNQISASMGINSGAYNKKAIMGIMGNLFFGTFTMISLKFMLDLSACPRYVEKIHAPIKPWKHG